MSRIFLDRESALARANQMLLSPASHPMGSYNFPVSSRSLEIDSLTSPFRCTHGNDQDLLQALSEAEQQHRLAPPESVADKAKDQVIAALRRRLDELKQTLAAKDRALRQKQQEIDRLYGKLATGSPLTDAELRQGLQAALQRLALLEFPEQ